MRQILINIDAGETHCDGCEHLTVSTWEDKVVCWIFNMRGNSINGNNMPRPPECLEAEQLAKER